MRVVLSAEFLQSCAAHAAQRIELKGESLRKLHAGKAAKLDEVTVS